MPLPPQLLPEPLPREPLAIAAEWLALARSRADQPNPNAMVIATVGADGQPSARVVLCKEIVVDPGYVCFFTNYLSRKGRELEAHPKVALVLHWDHLHRQVRIEGRAVRAPAAESDAYFRTRPWQRRIGAWASAQSESVDSRAALQDAVERTAARFGTPVPGPEDDPSQAGAGEHIPRPPHWGGYHVHAEAVELWLEGESRIHDRARWTRTLRWPEAAAATDEAARPVVAGPWRATRLQP